MDLDLAGQPWGRIAGHDVMLELPAADADEFHSGIISNMTE